MYNLASSVFHWYQFPRGNGVTRTQFVTYYIGHCRTERGFERDFKKQRVLATESVNTFLNYDVIEILVFRDAQ